MARVLVIANKDFEVLPLLGVLAHRKGRPSTLPPPVSIEPLDPPRVPGRVVRPRASIVDPAVTIEIWCVSDLLDDPRSSSSFDKQQRLPLVFQGVRPSHVIALGTASRPGPTSFNGCVAMGTQVFAVDPWANAPAGRPPPPVRASDPRLGTLVRSVLPGSFFRVIHEDVRYAAEARFVRSPIEPSEVPRILAVHGQVALNVWNIADYNDYVWADHAVVRSYEAAATGHPIGSMETTHALVRLATDDAIPFLWVSGIANRLGEFDTESGPRTYAQDFAAAHNAAITLAWVIAEILRVARAAPPAPAPAGP